MQKEIERRFLLPQKPMQLEDCINKLIEDKNLARSNQRVRKTYWQNQYHYKMPKNLSSKEEVS